MVFGTKRVLLNIRLRRIFSWAITVAKVSKIILCTESLSRYDIAVDLQFKSLIDIQISLASRGKAFRQADLNITAVKTPIQLYCKNIVIFLKKTNHLVMKVISNQLVFHVTETNG